MLDRQTIQRAEGKESAGPNLTGIPTQMKLDYERRSGLSFDDVRVHYNSARPARLQALAYTQGTQVYVGPGQERHLPHELGHVIQQKLGLVHPTMRMGGMPVNDDPRLERAADLMGSSGYGSSAPSPAPPVVQREKLVAAASLRFIPDMAPQSPEDYIVDSLKITGRADTGLKSGKNPTQGSHTIADVFIKRHQEIVVEGSRLVDAIGFYQALCHEVISHNILTHDHAKDSPIDAEREEGSNEAAHRCYSRCCELLQRGMGGELRQRELRKGFEDIVSDYNYAYAQSIFATQGKGSAGKGEGSAMGHLESELVNGSPDINKINKLLDETSILTFAEIHEGAPEIIKAKFYGMLFEMFENRYRYHINGNETDIAPENLNLWPKNLVSLDPNVGMNVFQERIRQTTYALANLKTDLGNMLSEDHVMQKLMKDLEEEIQHTYEVWGYSLLAACDEEDLEEIADCNDQMNSQLKTLFFKFVRSYDLMDQQDSGSEEDRERMGKILYAICEYWESGHGEAGLLDDGYEMTTDYENSGYPEAEGDPKTRLEIFYDKMKELGISL